MAILAVALLLPTISASGGQVAGSIDGPGWVLLDYVGSSGKLYLGTSAFFHGPGVFSIELRPANASGSWYRGMLLFPGVEVAAGPVSARPAVLPFGYQHDVRDLPGEMDARILIWSQSEFDPWSWNATVPPGAALTVVATGRDGYFWNGDEADAGVHAHASAGLATVSASAARYRFTVQHEFLGVAGLDADPEPRVSVLRPDGVREGCPCQVPNGPFAWGPGDYFLEWQRTKVGRSQTIVLAGVDVPDFPPMWTPPS